MKNRIIERIRQTSVTLNNGRGLNEIFRHALGEMEELNQELNKHFSEQEPGPDGIVGEAIDVILCMVDLIHQKDPSISNDQIYTIVCEKVDKWERLYGTTEQERTEAS